MPFDGTLKFDTAIDQSGFKAGLDGLGSIAKAGMTAVTAAVGAATGAVTALGGYAVSVGEGFESSMAQVIATMGITKDTVQDGVNSYELLRDAAAAAGEATTFSASEAADALNYLALAGYSAAQASEALPAVLDLAAAGGMALADASDLATDAMAAVGIEASKDSLTAFGDRMAKTASLANTNVSQLGEAILTVGGTAKVLAGGTEELDAALGVLANRGIKGAEGGTHLRNMLLSLSAPTDTAKTALDALGVSALDAEGNMRPLNDVFTDLQAAMDGMSDGDTASVLSDIFNKTDLAAAQALMAGSGDELRSLETALHDCDGAMSQMAQTMNDTLEGDMKSLGSKAEAFGIAVYDGLNAPLRELVQLGGEYVSALTDAFEEGGLDGLAAAFGDVLGDAVTTLTGYVPTLTALGTSLLTALAQGLADHAPDIARTALEAALTLVQGIGEASVDMWDLGASLLTSLAGGIGERLPRIRRIAREVVGDLAAAVVRDLPQMLEAGLSIAEALGSVILESIPQVAEAGGQLMAALGDMLLDHLPDVLAAGAEIVGALGNALLDRLPDVLSAGEAIAASLAKTLSDLITPENIAAVSQTAQQLVTVLARTLAGMLPLLTDTAASLMETLVTALLTPETVSDLAALGVRLLLVLTTALADNVGTLVSAAQTVVLALVTALTEGDTLQRLTEAGAQLLMILLTSLLDALPLLIETGASVLTALVEAIASPDQLARLTETAVQILTALTGALVDALPQLTETAVELIVYLVRALTEPDMLLRLVDAAADILLALTDALVDNIDTLLLAVQEIVTYLVEELLEPDNIQKLVETGAKLLAGIVKGVLQIGGSLIGFAVEMQREIKEELDSVDWAALGISILDGIIAGLTGVDGSFFGEFGDNFVTGLKDIFGIHSPSRVMRDVIGIPLAQGVEAGFTDAMPNFSEIVDEAADALTVPLPPVEVGVVYGDAAPPDIPTPDVPEMPDYPVPPEWPDVPEFPDYPVPPEWPDVPEFPDYPVPPDWPDFPELPVLPKWPEAPSLSEWPEMPGLPDIPERWPDIDPGAFDILRDLRLPAPAADAAATSEIVQNHYSTATTIHDVTNNAAPQAAPGGDIIIPLSIGGQQLETVVVKAVQIANARSGGHTL